MEHAEEGNMNGTKENQAVEQLITRYKRYILLQSKTLNLIKYLRPRVQRGPQMATQHYIVYYDIL